MPYKGHSERLAAARRMWRKHRHTAGARYRALKKTAQRKGIAVTLTLEQYTAVVYDAVCSYCGNPLPTIGYGLDRQNHLDGYHIGNVVPCCAKCNRLKGFLEGQYVTFEALTKIAEAVWGRRVD